MCFAALYGLVQVELEPASNLPLGRDERDGGRLLDRLAELLQVHLGFASIWKTPPHPRQNRHQGNSKHHQHSGEQGGKRVLIIQPQQYTQLPRDQGAGAG